MWAGAAAQLGCLITIIVTAGTVKAAVLHADPAAVPTAMTHIAVGKAGAPIVIAMWLALAWTINRRRDAARFGFASFFLLITMSMLLSLAQGGAVYAPADFIAAAVEWSLSLAAVVLIFLPASDRYYRQQAPALV